MRKSAAAVAAALVMTGVFAGGAGVASNTTSQGLAAGADRADQSAPMGARAGEADTLAQVREAWRRAFNAGDADAVLALYAKEATLASEAGTFTDAAGIRRWLQVSIEQGSRLESIEASAEETREDLGYSTGRSRRLVGTDVHLGQYLMILKRFGDEWKIVHHFSMNVR